MEKKTLLEVTESELALIEAPEEHKEEVARVNKVVKDIVKVLDKHQVPLSDVEAALEVVSRLIHKRPVTALTGEDDEWEYSEELSKEADSLGNTDVYVNKRCESVRKVVKKVEGQDDEISYHDTEAIVVSADGGITWWEKGEAVQSIEQFPYNPPVFPKQVYLKGNKNLGYSMLTNEEDILKVRNANMPDAPKAEDIQQPTE